MATIVIADPDTTHALTLQAVLEGEGHAVHTAQDGYEAIELCESLKPDMVFVAVNLAILTGPAVSEALRYDPEMARDMPIILLHSEALDARVTEQCRATASLERGSDAHTLRERVVDWLGERAGPG